MRQKWDKIPILSQSLFPIFPEVESLPFVKVSSPHSPTEKWDFCHSPTLTARAASGDAWSEGCAQEVIRELHVVLYNTACQHDAVKPRVEVAWAIALVSPWGNSVRGR